VPDGFANSSALSVTKKLGLTRYPKRINTKATQTKRKKISRSFCRTIFPVVGVLSFWVHRHPTRELTPLDTGKIENVLDFPSCACRIVTASILYLALKALRRRCPVYSLAPSSSSRQDHGTRYCEHKRTSQLVTSSLNPLKDTWGKKDLPIRSTSR
jgi:hypothetical protein